MPSLLFTQKLPRYATLGCLWLALFPTMVTAANASDCTRKYSLAYHDHGMLYSKAADAGIDKDVALEMIKRSGCQFDVTVMPRARIWLLIESGNLDFSMSGITSPARDQYANFAWYLYNKYYLLVRKDAGVADLTAFEKDSKLRLGAIRSFRYSKNLNELADKLATQKRIEEASDHENLLSMLRINRIQAMIIEPFNYSQVDRRELNTLTVTLEPDDPPVLHGLIMSKKSLSEADQRKWQGIIEGMRRDGTLLKILQKYFDPAMAKSMVSF